jgi:histone-arginine methyltransferase CARM1
LENPIFVRVGQILTGRVLLKANTRQSYDVTIEIGVEGTNTKSSNTLDLKNPYFRYTGQAAQPPPGNQTSSPSEKLWSSDPSGNVVMANTGSHMATSALPSGGMFSDYNGMNNGGAEDMVIDMNNVHHQHHSATHMNSMNPMIHSSSPSSSSSRSRTSSQHSSGMYANNNSSNQQIPQVILGSSAHFPVNNSLMIGDFAATGSSVMFPSSAGNMIPAVTLSSPSGFRHK